jgi:hypothetical protein
MRAGDNAERRASASTRACHTEYTVRPAVAESYGALGDEWE